MKAETLWSLPSASVTLIIALLLASVAIQQAISIDSDQPTPTSTSTSTKSESNLAPSPAAQQSYQAPPPPPQLALVGPATAQQQMIKALNAQQVTVASPIATASTRKPSLSSQSARNPTHNNGRIRRPTQATSAANQSPATSSTGLNHTQQEPTGTTTVIDADPLQEIKRIMAEYSNTPPLFVTATRDFFVDVARYPLGFKLATMQAVDNEGDPIEYSLKPANYRDASPFFSINSTSGELRLANRRIPLQIEPRSEAPLSAAPLDAIGNDDETDEGSDADRITDSIANDSENRRQLSRSLADQQQDANAEKPSHLYFLNVAANDGKYTTIVELQIHVFNSTSFGTKSPVQLTIENGRRGAENLMRSKTNEFINNLYSKSPSRSTTSQQPSANSTVVFPNFVNPSLVAPEHFSEDLNPYTTPNSLGPLPNSIANPNQEIGPNPSAARFEPGDLRPAAGDPNILQQSMVLNFVIVICSCFTLVLLLLIFIIPLSVKRLKRRLKNMELQHEQLSHKPSSAGSSIVCSSANSTHSAGSITTSGRLPSLSQFTLSSSSQMPDCRIGSNSRALGRQSSLDSAITSSVGQFPGSSLSYRAERYYPGHQQSSLEHGNQHLNQHFINQQQQQQLNQQFLTNNGLNRINNGAIVNPVYLHGQSTGMQLGQQQQQQHQQQLQQRHSSELNNIYCPIDDDFYSTINNELEAGGQMQEQQQQQQPISGMIVGQTYETRNYFASQCAPLEHHAQNEITISALAGDNNQQQRETDTPQSRASSRSSTRSLARFLSLPARHWSHQQKQSEQEFDASRKRKSSFLDELESQLNGNPKQSELKVPIPSDVIKTIARANHIAQEQQVRLGKRARKQNDQGQWELERHRLKFIDILDEGQFGLVWRCKLRCSNQNELAASSEAEQTVAVKTLKSFAARDERERQELLAEIEIMKLVCEHPNVVKILHCCTLDISQSRPILLVMEHVELGKLQSFLEKSRASHNYATTSSLYNHASQSMRVGGAEYLGAPAGSCLLDDEEDVASSVYDATGGRLTMTHQLQREQLTSRELIKFIYHVAKGMEYISGQCIVHRDLASRNILISAERVCKIGDFGMARHVASSCDVYERRSRNTKIPVRWMAPEVLLHNSFTSKSDVYSFGILMWEIVTLGSTPYANLKMEQIIEAVARQGQRPSKPDYCHSLLYSIMSRCWSTLPDERPTFSELVRQLDELLLSANEYIELDQYPDHNYYNIAPAPGELV